VHAVQRRPDDIGLAGDPVLVPADDLEDRLDSRLRDCDRAGDIGRMSVRGGVVGRVHRVDPLRHLGDPLVEDIERPSVNGGGLTGDDEPIASIHQFPQRRHAVVSRPGDCQPVGVSLSLPLRRLAHDDVPASRLSTGGRRSWMCCRHTPGRSGKVRARFSAFPRRTVRSGASSGTS